MHPVHEGKGNTMMNDMKQVVTAMRLAAVSAAMSHDACGGVHYTARPAASGIS